MLDNPPIAIEEAKNPIQDGPQITHRLQPGYH